MESLVEGLKAAINFVCEPKLYIILMTIWCTVSVFKPEWWVQPKRFAVMMVTFVALYFFSITDHNFQLIAFKGDKRSHYFYALPLRLFYMASVLARSPKRCTPSGGQDTHRRGGW